MPKFTAKTRKAISAPVRWLHERDLILPNRECTLDYGCGKGFDADNLGMIGWDPNWRPQRGWVQGTFDVVVCSYVLNVVTEEVQEEILEDISKALVPRGTAYIAVRRDLPKEGAPGRGCYQRYVVLDLPVLVENSKFAIYEMVAV